MVKTIVAANEAGQQDLAAKTDLAQFEDRLETTFAALEARFDALETKFDAMVNKMLLNQVAVYGLLFVALKLC